MALTPDRSVRTVILLGWTEPRPYAAGEFKTRDGSMKPYPAGRSMKLCVGTGPDGSHEPGRPERSFDVLKVKDADIESVWPSIKDAVRGTVLEITFTPARPGDAALCHGARALVTSGK